MSVLTRFRRLLGIVPHVGVRAQHGRGAPPPSRARGRGARRPRHGARGGARRGPPAVRQRRAGEGRLPRVVGPARARHAEPGRPLRAAQPAQIPVLHRRRPADAGPRHRRQHRDLQRRPRRAAAAAAVRARRSAGRSAAAGAEDRRRERGRVGEGSERLPRADASRSTPWSSTTRCRSTCSAAARRRASRPASSRPTSSTCLASRRCWAGPSAPTTTRRTRRPVLVLSYAYWQNTLGGDPQHRRPHLRDERSRPHRGRRAAADSAVPAVETHDVYMPPSACPFRSNPQTIENRNARMLTAIGRLKPGATLERAQSDLAVVSGRLSAQYPGGLQRARTPASRRRRSRCTTS